MGCCLSSTDKKSALHSPPHKPTEPTPPPPPPIEEETVKEVLSETPIHKNPPPPHSPPQLPTEQNDIPIPILHEIKPQPHDSIDNKRRKQQREEIKEKRTLEASQQSEQCSITADTRSTATTTTTLTEIAREDEAMSKNTSVKMSTTQVRRKRDIVSRSPSTGEKPRVKREQFSHGQATRTRTMQRNVGLGSTSGAAVRRDVGEGSGRRSRSPATRGVERDRVGGSPARTMTGKGRARPVRSGGENGRGKDEKEQKNDSVSMQQEEGRNETLDNPNVSLECFIFL